MQRTVKCAACGTENPPGAEYCVGCARRLDEETGQKIAQTRAASVANQAMGISWSAVNIAIGIIIVILVAVILILAFTVH